MLNCETWLNRTFIPNEKGHWEEPSSRRRALHLTFPYGLRERKLGKLDTRHLPLGVQVSVDVFGERKSTLIGGRRLRGQDGTPGRLLNPHPSIGDSSF
jgi:hypothetical protein